MPAERLVARAGLGLVALLLIACPKRTPPEQVYCAGVAGSVAEGVRQARDAVASGRALAKLSQFVACTRKLTA